MTNAQDITRQVAKQEFDAFVSAYPAQKLQQHVIRICDPHQVCLMDWSLPSVHEKGSADYFFDHRVAYISTDWMGPGGEVDLDGNGRFWQYFITRQS